MIFIVPKFGFLTMRAICSWHQAKKLLLSALFNPRKIKKTHKTIFNLKAHTKQNFHTSPSPLDTITAYKIFGWIKKGNPQFLTFLPICHPDTL